MKRCFVIFIVWISFAPNGGATEEFEESAFIKLIEDTPTVAIWGHGSKGQIAHKYQALAEIKRAANYYDTNLEKGNCRSFTTETRQTQISRT